MKRSHWALTYWAIRRFQKIAEKLKVPELGEMTPARYDILFVMWQRPDWVRRRPDEVYSMGFGQIIQKLGLHPTTITKCIKGLVKHKYATVHRMAHDARFKYVRMTRLGLRMFELAQEILFGRSEAFNRAIALFALKAPRWVTLQALDDFFEVEWKAAKLGRRLRRCAQDLGSEAWPIYDERFVDPELIRIFAGRQ